jgi:hypothetical protein
MTAPTYSLAPEPIWTMINLAGTVAGGAYMFTWHSLNKILPKAVYMDDGGAQAWTNPIIFDLNGTRGPFYWEVDPSNLSDTYFIQVYDADPRDPNSGANLLWDVDNFYPSSGTGGTIVTNNITLVNYITNNQFINHIGDTVNPVGVTNLVIAPSNHKGFTPALVNPIVALNGVVGPDIRFIKNNTLATDQITFPKFTLGTPVLTGDVTPVHYIRYQCTNAPGGETYKNFQFPIVQKVQNLTNQTMTFTLWGAVTSSPAVLDIYLRQYYGSGTAATVDTRTLIGTITLSTSWTPFNFNFTVPNVSGHSIGNPGAQTDDDAVYLQIEMPLGSICDVLFTKPCLYLGIVPGVNPNITFDTYDQIDAINSTPRTGDVRVSLTSAAPLGWLAMNDTSIGNTGSGATTTGDYVFGLYKTLWDGVSNSWAPVSPARGASAVADFLALKPLTMPLALGRALAGAGAGAGLTPRVLGQNLGTETNTLTAANLPSPLLTGLGLAAITAGGGPSVFINNNQAGSGVLPNTGGGQTTNNMQPTSFMNVFIKL